MAIMILCAIPRELMWICLGPALRIRDPDLGQPLVTFSSSTSERPVTVELRDLLDLGTGPVDRVQSRGRLLEDHRDVLATQRSDLGRLHLGDILATEEICPATTFRGEGSSP